MKDMIRFSAIASFLLISCGLPQLSFAQAVGAILNDGDDSFGYGVQVANGVSTGVNALPTSSTPSGVPAWNFNVRDGANNVSRIQHVASGNWFYRVQGDSRERQPANLSLVSLTANRVEYRFDVVGPGGQVINGFFGIMDFALTDTGPDSASLSTNICWFNQTQQDYNIESFLAVDIDLNGTVLGDNGLPTNFSNGRSITIVDGTTQAILATAPPFASGSGQGTTTQILGAMLNGTVSTFTSDPGSAGISGATDNAWLMQRSNLVQANSSGICTPTTLDIQLEPVPEPATMTVLALGLLGVLKRKSGRN